MNQRIVSGALRTSALGRELPYTERQESAKNGHSNEEPKCLPMQITAPALSYA
jgi:hypothetical protein